MIRIIGGKIILHMFGNVGKCALEISQVNIFLSDEDETWITDDNELDIHVKESFEDILNALEEYRIAIVVEHKLQPDDMLAFVKQLQAKQLKA